MLDNASNEPSRCGTKNWVEINNESRGMYTTGGDIKFKNIMLKSSLCDYSEAYILLKEI